MSVASSVLERNTTYWVQDSIYSLILYILSSEHIADLQVKSTRGLFKGKCLFFS